MRFSIAMLEVILLLILFHNNIKKHPVKFYIGCVCLAVFGIVSVITGWNKSVPSPIVDIFILPFVRGTFSTSLFIIVMWLGVLPKKYTVIRNIYLLRGELSIMASIFALGHNISYGITGGQAFIKLFITPSELPANRFMAAIISIVLILIMIPLFITSFKSIRRKMVASNWKRLQRFAYLFYILLYAHLLVLYIPLLSSDNIGKIVSAQQNLIIYSFVFIPYLIIKIIQFFNSKGKTISSY